MSLLTHGVEVELAHQVLEPEVLRPAGANLQPAGFRSGAPSAVPATICQRFGQGADGWSWEPWVGSGSGGTGWAGII
jgi:hypothetical protein